MLPPFPGWSGLHVQIIHFPIVLLLLVPLLLFAALVLPRARTVLTGGALLLLLAGTAAIILAMSTGEAAAELADRTPEVNAVIERHEELATTARLLFIVVTLALVALLAAPRLLKRPLHQSLQVSALAVVLLVVLAGDALIANVAHAGGRLVHVYGVHAIVPPERGAPVQPASTAPSHQTHEAEHD